MKVLIIDQFSGLGGAQLVMCDLIPGMLKRGWRVRVLIPPSGELWNQLGRLCVHVLPLPISSYSNGKKTFADGIRFLRDTLRASNSIQSAAQSESVDVLYVNGPRLLPAAARTSLPVVFHAHNYLSKEYARRIAGWCLRRADATVIAVSRFVAEPLRTYIHEQRFHIIYNGVATKGPERPAKKDGPIRVGMIGRIAPEKGHLDFIEAAKLIASRRSDIRFSVFGDVLFASEAFGHEVRTVARSAPVDFRGWVSDPASAFAELDLLIVPSDPIEATPRVIIEAFSAGVPVLTYRSGGIPELLDHGVTGLFTASRTPEDLAASIEELADNPALRNRLAIGGRESWRKRFTLEQFQEQICAVVQGAGRKSNQPLEVTESYVSPESRTRRPDESDPGS